jgi:gas vesicle protein
MGKAAARKWTATKFGFAALKSVLIRSVIHKVERKGVIVMAEESKGYGLAWFVAGLGVGALVGILYAPKSGRETREGLANSAREGKEYLRNRTQQAAEQVSVLVEKGKEQVGEYVDRGREVVDRGRAQWEEFVERGKNLVNDQSTRVSAAVEAGRQAYKATTDPTEPVV